MDSKKTIVIKVFFFICLGMIFVCLASFVVLALVIPRLLPSSEPSTELTLCNFFGYMSLVSMVIFIILTFHFATKLRSQRHKNIMKKMNEKEQSK